MASPSSLIVFFERTGTYRRWEYVAVMIGFSALALLGIVGIACSLLDGSVLTAPLLGIVGGTVWTLGMTAIAGVLAYHVLLRPTLYSRIDEFGITVNGRRWPWNRIEWVYAARSTRRMTLCFRQKGPARGLTHAIHGMPLLSDEEASRILERLSEFLATHFPHVSVG
jgi:hypothetical protein